MSRSLEKLVAFPGLGVPLTVLTVPSDHKYELVQVDIGGAGGVSAGYLIQITAASQFLFIGERKFAAGEFAHNITYGPTVFYEGDSLQVLTLTAALSYLISYVDVDYLN